MQKINNVEKSSEGQGWYQELPQIVKGKFDNYKSNYEHLSRIFKLEYVQIKSEMNKGYYSILSRNWWQSHKQPFEHFTLLQSEHNLLLQYGAVFILIFLSNPESSFFYLN